MDINDAALARAVSQIGVHEQGGANKGPQVDAYLASVHLRPGFSWCAAFVYWCFDAAARDCGMVNPCPRTAAAVRLWNLADAACRTQVAAPGLVYVLDHGHGVGHAGIVETVSESATDGKRISEISGNTNDQGAREGNAVARHAGKDPAAIHGGYLIGYLDFSKAAQWLSAQT